MYCHLGRHELNAVSSRETSESRRIVIRIRILNATEDSETLEKSLGTIKHKLGRNRVLTANEESVLVPKLIYASKRGFGLDIGRVPEGMCEIGKEGRPTYENSLPSMETVRRFRDRHRELMYRTSQQKEF